MWRWWGTCTTARRWCVAACSCLCVCVCLCQRGVVGRLHHGKTLARHSVWVVISVVAVARVAKGRWGTCTTARR